jgi:hypothetical protein
MRINALEGVNLSSRERQAAFILTVAEAYDAAPNYDPKAEQCWKALMINTQMVLFKRLQGTGIKVILSEADPYKDSDTTSAIKFMLYDMIMNKTLRVYTGFSNAHPTFTEEQNIIFRAVHDFFTHGSLRKKFLEGLKLAAKKSKITNWPMINDAGPLLNLVSLPSHAFTPRGEFNATSSHIRLAPKLAAPAIFTEVVGQVCYNEVVGRFPVQKVAILKGFDYQNIGVCIAGSFVEHRLTEILGLLTQGVENVSSTIQGMAEVSTKHLLDIASRH